jgi:hypothetical protein
MRLLIALVCVLIPLQAHAALITFDFAAGDVSGWYTVETNTPGIALVNDWRQEDWARDAGMRYAHAVTAFSVFVSKNHLVSGSTGDLSLNVSGYWGNSYLVTMVSGPDYRLDLSLWSAAGEDVITGESLTERPALLTESDLETHATLYDLRRNVVARDEPISSLTAREQQTSSRAVAVPEPSTALLCLAAFGLLVGHRRRPILRGRRLFYTFDSDAPGTANPGTTYGMIGAGDPT